MRNLARSVLTLALTTAAACSASGPTELSYEPGSAGIQAGYVSVTATSAGLLVSNQTERAVYTQPVERAASARYDWAPCTFFASCGAGLAPGATITIAWATVAGYKPDATEYVLYWYHVQTASGTTTTTGIQSIIVKR